MPELRIANAVVIVAALSISACGDDGIVQPPPPEIEQIDLNGVWDFTERLVLSSLIMVCRDTGSITVSQPGKSFSASGEQVGHCQSPLVNANNTRTIEFSGGSVRDSTFTFVNDLGCRYEGRLVAGPPVKLTGRSACSINFDGVWEAVRAGPIASVAIEPDSARAVVGQRFFPNVVLRNQFGWPLFERSVSLSTSDASILRASLDGSVVAVDAGTATVAAAAEGLTGEMDVTVEFLSLASISAGIFHSCSLSPSGTPFCWGSNEAGQSGPAPSLSTCNSGVTCLRAPSEVPVTVPLVSMHAGFLNTCGLSAGGDAYCWGVNSAGQLGIDTSTSLTTVPVAVSGGLTFSSLSVGTNHVCGLSQASEPYCWGFNFHGVLGIDESTTFTTSPTPVSGGHLLSSIRAGEQHTCGLTAAQSILCWGDNLFGQVGIDASVDRTDDPTPLDVPFAATALATGRRHSCGLQSDGRARCWGFNFDGQLGVDTLSVPFFSENPVDVSSGRTFTSLTLGAHHSCGLDANGAAWCWGRNQEGQLGNGLTNDVTSTPTPVAGGLQFTSISAGWEHTCGITPASTVYCWGSNSRGQLGIANLAQDTHPLPVKVLGQPD